MKRQDWIAVKPSLENVKYLDDEPPFGFEEGNRFTCDYAPGTRYVLEYGPHRFPAGVKNEWTVRQETGRHIGTIYFVTKHAQDDFLRDYHLILEG